MASRFRSFVGILALVAWMPACGGGPALHPVTGIVQFPGGKPMPGGRVVLETMGEEGPKYSAQADIESDGSFELFTAGRGKGVPVGQYRAIVTPPPPADADKPTPPMIDKKYLSLDSSGLGFEIKPGKNELTIEVKAPKKK